MPRLILLIGGAVPCPDGNRTAVEASRCRQSCRRKAQFALTADLPRRTASIASSSVAGHAPRHSPFHAAFRYLHLGQRSLAGSSSNRAAGGAHGVQHAFRRFSPTKRAERALSRRPDPPAVGELCLTGRFRQLDRAPVRACDGLTDARSEAKSARLGGSVLSRRDPPLRTPQGRSCLRLLPLAGLRAHDLHVQSGGRSHHSSSPAPGP